MSVWVRGQSIFALPHTHTDPAKAGLDSFFLGRLGRVKPAWKRDLFTREVRTGEVRVGLCGSMANHPFNAIRLCGSVANITFFSVDRVGGVSIEELSGPEFNGQDRPLKHIKIEISSLA